MSRLYDYLSMGPFVQVILETKGTILKIHKACLIKRVHKCASPYDFHRWRTPPIHWRMAMFNTTGSLNQNLYPGRRRMLLTTSLDTDSGESCAEIRIIKYCAEPSVRELP